MSDPVFTCLDCGEHFASRGAAFQHIDANPTHGIGGTVFAELSQKFLEQDGHPSPDFVDLYRELAQAGIGFVLAEREEKRALDRCGEIRRSLLDKAHTTTEQSIQAIGHSAELEVAIGFARKCGEIVTRRETEWKALARQLTAQLEEHYRG
jgi:2,4-dienoyl-CoA reductase-like NADH-dependent reductase (Old Yellow Enzyme family)